MLNKALIPQIALAFNSVNLSHDCLLLSLVTLKLVGPVLLSHTRQYSLLSVSIILPSVSLSDFCCLESYGSLRYRTRQQVTVEDVEVVREQQVECWHQ